MIDIGDDLELIRGFFGLIVCCDELLESEKLKILRKIFPKMTLLRVVTITENHLISEVFFVVFEFLFYIR
jgi:hypothetical protein